MGRVAGVWIKKGEWGGEWWRAVDLPRAITCPKHYACYFLASAQKERHLDSSVIVGNAIVALPFFLAVVFLWRSARRQKEGLKACLDNTRAQDENTEAIRDLIGKLEARKQI